ncbi:class I SAM-dependent methyltransferase [Pelagibius marinus]|uniref:class I SAM-dependent methyltransferase n=1 Tax=Pelagibius marinus TaxID=2762760 RepID=UPI0018724739|nr:class I SAM-dependent methyltransferase [Pelagibius marinus]
MDRIKRTPASGPDGAEEMSRVLAESLPLARQWSAELCWRDPESGESCAWYHGAWQTLRLLGIVTTLTQQSELYIEALRPLIAEGGYKRVFLSGSADYGLLSVVLEAFSNEAATPEITVVDRCETPLRLCRWYAERYGYAIETAQSDLQTFRAPAPYDLICVHSLLSCVPVQHHAEIVATWHSLLRPGGVLMMANNLYIGNTARESRFTPEQISAYQERVAKAALTCPHPEALPSAEELQRMATAYAAEMSGSIISSREQLTGLLEDQGFSLEVARFGNLVKDRNHQRSGAPTAGKREYAWIVARRR